MCAGPPSPRASCRPSPPGAATRSPAASVASSASPRTASPRASRATTAPPQAGWCSARTGSTPRRSLRPPWATSSSTRTTSAARACGSRGCAPRCLTPWSAPRRPAARCAPTRWAPLRTRPSGPTSATSCTGARSRACSPTPCRSAASSPGTPGWHVRACWTPSSTRASRTPRPSTRLGARPSSAASSRRRRREGRSGVASGGPGAARSGDRAVLHRHRNWSSYVIQRCARDPRH
mmetsp:Transcript_15625/g.52749  ORF Transcript_15625/g.52749 Transcript_15625/m.52749 type:complete len:235 (-) Transcript_15625:140-844(-)